MLENYMGSWAKHNTMLVMLYSTAHVSLEHQLTAKCLALIHYWSVSNLNNQALGKNVPLKICLLQCFEVFGFIVVTCYDLRSVFDYYSTHVWLYLSFYHAWLESLHFELPIAMTKTFQFCILSHINDKISVSFMLEIDHTPVKEVDRFIQTEFSLGVFPANCIAIW